MTIGLPVFNGEHFLHAALDSILAQEFGDLEVVVSDNGSTDATPEIVAAYAGRDERIRSYRSETNNGAAWNFNRVFSLARAGYFMWMAHDDLLEPEFLTSCVRVLDEDPTIAVCYSRLRIIDDSGNDAGVYDFKLPSDSSDPCVRYRCLVHASHKAHLATEIFGVMRADVLRRTPLMSAWAHADRCLLVRLALLGRFHQVPRSLMGHRRHPAQSMRAVPEHVRHGTLIARLSSRLARKVGTGPLPPTEWFDPTKRGRVTFPDWRRIREYYAAVQGAPVGWRRRLRCRASATLWALKNAPRLARDVVAALDLVLSRAFRQAGRRSS